MKVAKTTVSIKQNIKSRMMIFILLLGMVFSNFLAEDTFAADEPFTGASGVEETYSWSIDANGHLTIYGDSLHFGEDNYPKWTHYEYAEYIKSATVNLEGKSTNVRGMFQRLNNLTEIDFKKFDTSCVTDMSFMFNGCRNLKLLDASGFETSNVTNMSYMFLECLALEKIDVSSFNTANVTNMSYMFLNCQNLKNIDLSSFNTSKVRDMSYMFLGCQSLEKIDVSKFDTSNVTDICCMFSNCLKIQELDLSAWDFAKIEDTSGIFGGMPALNILTLPKTPIDIYLNNAFVDQNGNIINTIPAGQDGPITLYSTIYAESECFKIGHSYTEPRFTWNTFPNVKLVTKCDRKDCIVKKYAYIEIPAEVSSKVTPATIDKEGLITYTAEAEYNGTKYTEEVSVVIPRMNKEDQEEMSNAPQTSEKEDTKEETPELSNIKPVGYVFTYQGAKYKVTKSSKTAPEVQYMTKVNKNSKTASVPSKIKVDGITYKVTSIAKNAFKNRKKLTRVTIGTNVSKIDSNAFYGCKKLKTIVIKSKKLKTVGKNAIKGIHKNARIDVPNSKRKAYKKLFKTKTGYKKTMLLK